MLTNTNTMILPKKSFTNETYLPGYPTVRIYMSSTQPGLHSSIATGKQKKSGPFEPDLLKLRDPDSYRDVIN
jgi:hypothetical protein